MGETAHAQKGTEIRFGIEDEIDIRNVACSEFIERSGPNNEGTGASSEGTGDQVLLLCGKDALELYTWKGKFVREKVGEFDRSLINNNKMIK